MFRTLKLRFLTIFGAYGSDFQIVYDLKDLITGFY